MWKQPKCLSTDERIKEMWYIRTMERYYSAIKRNEILIHATISMNLENTVQSEINQTQKDKYCMISVHEVPRAVKCIEAGSNMEVTSG